MPRYFFHLRGDNARPDLVGVELPDMPAVRRHAVVTFATIIVGLDGRFWERTEWGLDVTDAARVTVIRLDLIATESPIAGEINAPVR